MRSRIAMLLGFALASPAIAQLYASQAGCASGQCPIVAGPDTAAPAVDSRAIVRVVNARSASRTAGTGTLVDADGEHGLIITCAHLFREGAGQVEVIFPNQQAFQAQLLKLDAAADLAALSIQSPRIEPVKIAAQFPRPGDWLVSCGYGTDGQLWCNRGQALGYVSVGGGHGSETLELTGSARSGDSGGPVFDRSHQLVAVLFGTNGRVVDATFCGRIRQFLTGLSPRFRSPPPVPRAPPQNAPAPVVPEQPLVQVPPPSGPPTTDPASADRLAKLEQLVSRINQTWQALNTKIDALAAAAESARQASLAKGDSPPLGPPKLDLPPGMESIGQGADPLAQVAEPWLSAKVAALLISLGVPGGMAGVAAGAAVWLVMRRAKKRLQDELDRLKGQSTSAAAATAPADGGTTDQSAVVERHHTQYVAYETNALDKAWAAAHAHVGEKYPGAVPYLKLVEGVKDQLLSGNNEPQSS